MTGFYGVEGSAALSALLDEYHVGNVVLFERNVASPAQVRQLTGWLQEEAAKSNAGLGMLVSIDQEGGTVARFRPTRGFTEFPSAECLAARETRHWRARWAR